jgi:hypothetical protein
VLQYSNGYANVTGRYYRIVEHVQNAAQCAGYCASDMACAAWTRVAGGRTDVQSCYLMSGLGGAEGNAAALQLRGSVSPQDPLAYVVL